MSRDRLNDFNNSAPSHHPGGYGEKEGYQAPVEMAPLRGNALSQFFQETEVIQSKIQQLQSSLNEIEQLSTRTLNAAGDTEGNRLLADKTTTTNKLSSEIYDRLRALTQSNMKVQTREEYDQRKLRTSTLSKQFKDAMIRFQNVQTQHRQKSKDNMARQYRIANPAATEDDIRRLVDEDNGGIFSQQLLQQARGQQASIALNNVQDRHRELQRLQESIVELSQLFQQLEHLIMDQDQTFHQIEGNVVRAEENLESGLGSVGLALQDARSARKKKWMALGIVALIIIIILIIGAAQGWFKSSA